MRMLNWLRWCRGVGGGRRVFYFYVLGAWVMGAAFMVEKNMVLWRNKKKRYESDESVSGCVRELG